MKVRELIEHLSTLDPELTVFVPGYEDGFRYASSSDVKEFCLNVNTEWYYGPHVYKDNVEREEHADYEHVKGIVL
jgi:hypothetical protein